MLKEISFPRNRVKSQLMREKIDKLVKDGVYKVVGGSTGSFGVEIAKERGYIPLPLTVWNARHLILEVCESSR